MSRNIYEQIFNYINNSYTKPTVEEEDEDEDEVEVEDEDEFKFKFEEF